MKTLTVVSRLLALIGLALLAGAYIAYTSASSYADRASRAHGQVIDLIEDYSSEGGTTFYPVVSFAVANGDVFEFRSSFGANPPAYEIGEEVQVMYDPANPSDATVEGFWSQYLVTVILAALGVSFLGIGLGLMITRIRARRRRESLQLTGRRVSARLLGVSINERIAVNGRNPWRVDAQWVDPDTGQVHSFQSENLWFDPSDMLTGDTVDVLIDPVNPKRYAIDIDARRGEMAAE